MAIVAEKYKQQNFGIYVDSTGSVGGSPGIAYAFSNDARNSIESEFNNKIYVDSSYAIWGTGDLKGTVYGNGSKVIDAVDLEWAPYSTYEKQLRTSGDVVNAIRNNEVKYITVQTSSETNKNIDITAFLTWMVKQGHIPCNITCHRIFRTSWSYTGNDNLCINDNDTTKEYIGLEGSTIEFTGYIYYSGSNDDNVDLTLVDVHNFEIKFTCAPMVSGTSYPRSIWVYRNNSGNYQPGFDRIIGKQYNYSSTQTGEIFNDYNSNVASGVKSHAEGGSTKALGNYSHAEGKSTQASGACSHAEGNGTEVTSASNSGAHAEGYQTKATATGHAEGYSVTKGNILVSISGAHAEGYASSGKTITASGYGAHAEGYAKDTNITASGHGSHAEGKGTTASGLASHTEGTYTVASNVASHAEGSSFDGSNNITASGQGSHAGGFINKSATDKGTTTIVASGNGSHASGFLYNSTNTTNEFKSSGQGATAFGYVINGDMRASGNGSFVSGYIWGSYMEATGHGAHAEGVALGSAIHANGLGSHAEGINTSSTGTASHAEGGSTTASASYTHAEGKSTQASGACSHAEGGSTKALGNYSHAEGNGTEATSNSNSGAHVEGYQTKATATGHAEGYSVTKGNILVSNSGAHAEGYASSGKTITASGYGAHAEGYASANITASNYGSHAEGDGTNSSGWASHAEGCGSVASGSHTHAEGNYTSAIGNDSHSEGQATCANGYRSHAEGVYSYTSGDGAHAEGYITIAAGHGSHSEGMCGSLIVYSAYSANSTTIVIKRENNWTAVRVGMYIVTWKHWSKITAISKSDTTCTLTLAWALGNALAADATIYLANTSLGASSHTEGSMTLASGGHSHAEGYASMASGTESHAEGSWTTASGNHSHAEGQSNTASGNYSHAEGQSNTASGQYAHVEGYDSLASGLASHAEGKSNTASGIYSHSGGCSSTSSQAYSFVHGCQLRVSNTYEAAFGKYNKTNTNQRFSIGNGTSTTNSNAFEVYSDGTTYVRGPLKVGKSDTTSYIAFYGTTDDGPGLYQTSFIGEHIWAGTESSELLLMKYNDGPNASGTTSTTPTTSGPDRIRHIAHGHIFQIPTDSSQGDFMSMAYSNNVSTKFDISNKLTTSYNSILITGPATPTMSNTTTNPRLIFGNLESGAVNQKVGIIYTDYDTYRPSKGLKVGDVDGVDTGNVWFEVQGFTYSAGFYKNSSSNDYALTGQGGHVALDTFLYKRTRRNLNISSDDSGMIPPSLLEFKNGYPLHDDPEFATSYNDINVYDTASSGNVTKSRQTDTSAGNSTGYVLKIHSSTSASPHCGGWCFRDATSRGKDMTCIFRAKAPSGSTISWHSNSCGDGNANGWLTSNTGTGKWEWYAYHVKCGSSGTFSSTNYFALNTTGDWYLSFAQTFVNSYPTYDGFRSKFSNNADKVDNYHVVVENGTHTGSSNDTLYFVTGGEASGNFLPLDTGTSITNYPYVIANAQTYFQTHIKIAGNVYATSDIRVKNVLNAWTINIEQLASLPIFNYTWKNKDDNTIHIGTSAQAVEEIIPELVSDNGEKSLDYSTLGTIVGIMSAREIVKLKEENKQLKSEIELLKNQLSEIKDMISKIQK